MLDIGRPLWADADDEVPLPPIAGLRAGGDTSLEGVVITHGHPDHYGLIDQVSRRVPVFMGQAAARILSEAAFFSPNGMELAPTGFLEDGTPFRLGPFTITPLLVDHSGFDAYAVLVEAAGRRLLYTGDLRAHGRKPGTFDRLLDRPPGNVHVLLMEGTRLSREEPSEDGPATEREVEELLVETFRATEGMVLALYSPQNIDRYVSMYKAALRADRDLVVDLYTAGIAGATGRNTIPQADWERVRVFVPQAQRIRVKQTDSFERVNAVQGSRLFPEQLKDLSGHLVMTFRGSMARDLERAGCLDGASAVWSMWPGYLDRATADPLKAFLKQHDVPLSVIHASGHATVHDLKRLAGAVAPERLVPIHTATPHRFGELFGRVEPHLDGEWWDV